MPLNARADTAISVFTDIQNTSKGISLSVDQAFQQFHAGLLTYERIYNDFIPKVKTAINALPSSSGFSQDLETSMDALALTLCGASNYSEDYRALEILLDELLVLCKAAIPVDTEGFVLVLKDTASGSEVIPEMLDISTKLNDIRSLIG